MKLIQAGIVLLSIGVLLVAAEPVQEIDISCEHVFDNVGNCFADTHTLKISGPQTKEWRSTSKYQRFCDQPNVVGNSETVGTYAFDKDLVIFTGKNSADNQQSTRFGLNYAFINKKVTFNRFFRDANGDLTYHVKTFRFVKNELQPAEEIQLTILSVPEANEKTWELSCNGFRRAWSDDQKMTEEKLQLQQSYNHLKDDFYQVSQRDPQGSQWFADSIHLQRVENKVEAVYGIQRVRLPVPYYFP